ncbi:B-cell receptor CD22-like, partial [Scomber scombrus]
VQGQNDWGVTYTSTHICAIKGSTVDINCTYRYPSRINNVDTAFDDTFWFTKGSNNEPVDLRTDSDYADRVQYHCDKNDCTLTIRDLRERDSAEYKFMFITNQPGGKYTASPGTTLTVTEPNLQVQVFRSTVHQYHTWAELKCHSSCRLPDRSSFIWYKNGQKIQDKTSSTYEGDFTPANSYSCALKGFEHHPAPSVCVRDQSCNRVIYTDRSICAFRGSSVDISCTYTVYYGDFTSFWFSPDSSHRWQNHSQPEDLSKDSQYTGRVQVLKTERGRSTLRISDLRESDSAQYHFTFKTYLFEWGSSLPGTTLTVTALQVQVITITVHQSHMEAELKCLSSCSPAGRISYVWFKNGQKMMKEDTSLYSGQFNPGDNISCALKGHEDYRSPSVYAPKLPSVSVSPSAEIVEGSSVTLTCSSDANPAAKYTWYKKNVNPDLQPLSKEPQLVFSSIQSSDSGEYYCTAENQLGKRTSEYIFIDVKYAPKLPSVSVSPSAEIVEGSSVTLTCSSDANPAANYTWYKENEDSPKASGQIFTITDFRPEHSGNYSCEAQNRRGRHNSTLHLMVVTGTGKSIAAGVTTAVLLLMIILSVFLWVRKKRASNQLSEAEERPDDRERTQPEQDNLHYASVQFSNNQADPLYSNIRSDQLHRHMEEQEVTEYAAVNFNRAATAPRTRGRETGEDPAALYSTVNKML